MRYLHEPRILELLNKFWIELSSGSFGILEKHELRSQKPDIFDNHEAKETDVGAAG